MQPSTYGYDVTESKLRQGPVWHARAGINAQTQDYIRWRARGSTASSQVVLVGDYATGAVYTLDLTTYQDNGVTLPRDRTAPFLSAENQWIFLDQVELGTQAGSAPLQGGGTPATVLDPKVELLVSRDGGQTFASAGFGRIGKTGEYLTRCKWQRLGRFRQDRMVLRTRQTDPSPCVWGPGVWLTTTSATGQL